MGDFSKYMICKSCGIAYPCDCEGGWDGSGSWGDDYDDYDYQPEDFWENEPKDYDELEEMWRSNEPDCEYPMVDSVPVIAYWDNGTIELRTEDAYINGREIEWHLGDVIKTLYTGKDWNSWELVEVKSIDVDFDWDFEEMFDYIKSKVK